MPTDLPAFGFPSMFLSLLFLCYPGRRCLFNLVVRLSVARVISGRRFSISEPLACFCCCYPCFRSSYRKTKQNCNDCETQHFLFTTAAELIPLLQPMPLHAYGFHPQIGDPQFPSTSIQSASLLSSGRSESGHSL